jgi:hypothetical protein
VPPPSSFWCRFVFLSALLAPSPAYATQVIARTGDYAVGLSGATYYFFDPLAFTEAGALLFGSQSRGLEGAADGLWQWTPTGGIEPIVLGGDHTPYGLLRRAVANEAGDFAFEGRRRGPPPECDGQLMIRATADALWLAKAGTPPIAVWTTGDVAPGAPDSLRFLGEENPYSSHLRLSVDTLVFAATLAPDVCPDPPPIERSALFHRDAEGVVRLVALEDALAPDAPDGARFAFFFSDDISIHSSGRIVFAASLLRREDFAWFTASAIYRYDPIDGLVPIAIGPWNDYYNGGVVYSGAGFGSPSIDVDGTVYFSKRRWENLNTVESEVIAARPSEALERLIGLGDPVPGMETSTIAEVVSPAVANGAGDIALVARINDEVDWAILEIEADGTVRTRLRDKDAAPSSDGGWFGYPRPYILRYGADGSLVVGATVKRSPFGEEQSLYRLERDGPPQRLAFPGYQAVIDPSGSTAAGAEWVESGLHKLSVAPVPEPATLALAIAALGSLTALALTTAPKSPPA